MHFGEEEKMKVRMLVMAKKAIVGNKKRDFSLFAEKKKTWVKITEEFNSSGQFPIVSYSILLLCRRLEGKTDHLHAMIMQESLAKCRRFDPSCQPSWGAVLRSQ